MALHCSSGDTAALQQQLLLQQLAGTGAASSSYISEGKPTGVVSNGALEHREALTSGMCMALSERT